jgi:hypothetical protein
MAAEKAAGTWPLKQDSTRPQPITREWARGSVEWHAQQRGEGGPPPQHEVPKSTSSAASTADEEIRELFSSTLKP